MVDVAYCLVATSALFIMVFVTRALPFWFGSAFKNSVRIKTIGQFLPAYMMMLLVIFEIKPGSFLHWPYALPAIISLIMLTIVHLWKRQVLLSIACGTFFFLLLNWLLI